MSDRLSPSNTAARERDARSILRRVGQEDGPPQAAAEDGDWAERWGRRIGRALSLFVTLAIAAWLALHLFGG